MDAVFVEGMGGEVAGYALAQELAGVGGLREELVGSSDVSVLGGYQAQAEFVRIGLLMPVDAARRSTWTAARVRRCVVGAPPACLP